MSIIHFRCHQCNTLLEIEARYSGEPVRCLSCQQVTICHDEPEQDTLTGTEQVVARAPASVQPQATVSADGRHCDPFDFGDLPYTEPTPMPRQRLSSA